MGRLPLHNAKCTPGIVVAQSPAHATGHVLATHTKTADAAPLKIVLKGLGR
jgi:hypothetical protein